MKSTEEILSNLVQVCLDAKNRYHAAASHASLGNLRSFLEEQERLRGLWASELQKKIAEMGGEPPKSGTISGTVNRLAMDLNVDLAGDIVLVNRCEEDAEKTERECEKALANSLPDSCREIVERQHQGIRDARKKLEALRAKYEQAQAEAN